jgi:hypothetical protein
VANTTSGKPPASMSSKTLAMVTGGAGGTGLIAWAKSLHHPWNEWLTLLAPLLSALGVTFWPTIHDLFAQTLQRWFAKWSRRRILKELGKYIARQEKALQDQTISPEERERLGDNVRNARMAKIKIDYGNVAEYVESAALPPTYPSFPSKGNKKAAQRQDEALGGES